MNNPGAMEEKVLALFAVGLLLFNPPLLSLFSVNASLFGFPALYIYLFASWGAAIALVAYMVNRRGRAARGDGMPHRRDGR
jgi:hypothetical protein